MRNKKGLLITLIVIIVILILAIGGFAYAYVATDLLKSNEQLFSKYMGQAGEKVSNFGSEALGAYINRKNEKAYENEGKLTVNVDMPNMEENYLKLLNGLNITFEGKTDKSNQKAVQSLKLNYSDNVSFPLEYKHTDNLYGIISDVVINKYIAIKNENIEELLGKYGVSQLQTSGNLMEATENIANINAQTIIDTMTKCKNILKENITKENYTKSDNNAYTLTISDTRVITGIIGELENSGILPETLGDVIEQELMSKTIKITVNKNNNIICEIEDLGTVNIEIADKVIRITPKMQDEETSGTITLTKDEVGSQLSYTIDFSTTDDDTEVAVSLNMQYSNLEGQTVRENYKLGLSTTQGEQSVGYEYSLTNTNKFVNKIEIEPLTEENTVILNDKTEEYIATLFTRLATVVSQINTVQMQQLGLSVEQNPLIYATPLGLIMNMKQSDVNTQPIDENAAAILNFNTPIKRYEGMQTGTATKNLIQTIISSNEQNSEHIVSVNGMTDGREIINYSSSLTSSQSYNIIINQDEQTGYIVAVNII